MSSTPTRGAAVRLIVARLLRRSSAPGRLVVGGRWVGALLTAAGLAGVAAGVAVLPSVVAVGVGALVWLAAEVGRRVTPAIAVSVVGIALGVAALFTVNAVMNGFEREVIQRSARVNGHVLLTKYGLDFFEYERIAAEVLARPEVVGASPFAVGAVALGRIDPTTDAREDPEASDALASENPEAGASAAPVVALLKGVDPRRMVSLGDVGSVIDVPLDAGLRPGHLERPPGLVLGRVLGRRLGVELGDRVSVVTAAAVDGRLLTDGPPRSARFEVTGWLDTGVAEFDREFALAHLSAAQFVLFGEPRVTGIELALASLDDAHAQAEAIGEGLNRAHNGGLTLYRATSWLEANTTLVMLRQVGQVVGIVVGLIVVVASTTLIGALLLVVRRRVQDIAILGAMGADRRLLWWVFEALGLTAGIVGVLAGLGLGGIYCLVIAHWGLGLDPGVYPIQFLPVSPSAPDALVPAAVALVVCALASGPAALVAARVRPVVALRG